MPMDDLCKLARDIYLAEVSEEGVELFPDNDARELARRSFRLAEIFLIEELRARRPPPPPPREPRPPQGGNGKPSDAPASQGESQTGPEPDAAPQTEAPAESAAA